VHCICVCIVFVCILYCNCVCIVIVFAVCSLSIFFNFVCCVLFGCGVLFCVLCVIVVLLPPGTNPFAVKINNNKIIIIIKFDCS
jgi:hypothetical protein